MQTMSSLSETNRDPFGYVVPVGCISASMTTCLATTAERFASPSTTSTHRMDFRLTDEQTLLRRTVREFAETEIRPHVREWDETQHFPSEIIPALAELGLMGIQVPEQYGGSGMSSIDYCLCIEEL